MLPLRSNADLVEMVLATYIAGRPIDVEVLEQTRAEADKDLQAEEARRLPLVYQARELAQEMGLLDETFAQEPDDVASETPDKEAHSEEARPRDSDLLAQALGGPTEEMSLCSDAGQNDEPKRPTWVAADTSNDTKSPSNHQPAQASWSNSRLRFNPQSRLATKAQRKEILRRDGWCCQAPGCPHTVWLHLHHLKSYAEGGETSAVNLCSLCSTCHANLHSGALRIGAKSDGTLRFQDGEGRRLDRRASLEVAGWGLEDSERLRLGTGGTAGKEQSRTPTALRPSKGSGAWPFERRDKGEPSFETHRLWALTLGLRP